MFFIAFLWMVLPDISGLQTETPTDSDQAMVRQLILENRYQDAAELLSAVPRSERDLQHYLLVSQVSLAQQQYEFAIQALQIARGLAPDDLNLMLQLARVYRAAGQNDTAESLTETIINRDVNHRQALILYGGIQSEKGNWIGVRRVYTELVRQDSTNTFFRYQLAQALNQLSDKGGALIQLREAHRISPTHHGVLHDLIRINYELNLNDIARDYAERGVRMSPTHIPFRKRLAEINFRERRYLDAAAQYREIIALGERIEGNFRNLGMSYYFANEFESAISAFKTALGMGDDPNAHFYMAMSLNQLGQHTQAINHLESAAQNSMGNLLADSYIQLGSIFDRTGNLESSIQNYEIARRLRPDRPDIYFYMASAYDRTGQHRGLARDYYRTYLLAETTRDATMESYAQTRVRRLSEEIHFRGE